MCDIFCVFDQIFHPEKSLQSFKYELKVMIKLRLNQNIFMWFRIITYHNLK